MLSCCILESFPMDDKTLLELAAKAAGEWPSPEPFEHVLDRWNPRTDSGQALELAVKLRKMPVIRWSDGQEWVFIPGHEAGAEPLGDDPLAATRLAIVRAAAEIGRSMT